MADPMSELQPDGSVTRHRRDFPADADLLPDGSRRCNAHNRQGLRCGRPAVPGTWVCTYHGGNAPQVRRKARLRLAELVDPAIATIARIMTDASLKPADRLRAAENILDRAGVVRRSELDPDTAREILAERLAQMLAADTIEGETVEAINNFIDGTPQTEERP